MTSPVAASDTYIRFVVQQRDCDSGVSQGIFQQAFALSRNSSVASADRQTLEEVMVWFRAHLRKPERFNRSRSKGYDRRSTRGVCWFRSSAVEHLRQAHRVKTILEANGYPVSVITEHRVGYVVYADEHQVVAEPFSDTRTG